MERIRHLCKEDDESFHARIPLTVRRDEAVLRQAHSGVQFDQILPQEAGELPHARVREHVKGPRRRKLLLRVRSTLVAS